MPLDLDLVRRRVVVRAPRANLLQPGDVRPPHRRHGGRARHLRGRRALILRRLPRRLADDPRDAEDAGDDSHGDHRLAMAWAVASLVARGEMQIHDSQCVDVSYPDFWRDLQLISEKGV